MENIVVLNEEQFEDIIYRTVSRLKASMTVMRYATCYTSRILLCGVLRSRAF